MHMPGEPAPCRTDPHYDDVVAEVRPIPVAAPGGTRTARASPRCLRPIPGIGFGKTSSTTSSCSAHLDQLVATGFPGRVGTSRKSSMVRLTGKAAESSTDNPRARAGKTLATPVPERLEASIATAVCGRGATAHVVRVHDVASTVAARRLAATAQLAP